MPLPVTCFSCGGLFDRPNGTTAGFCAPCVKRMVAKLQLEAEDEVERLKQLGWNQEDFARALKGELERREIPGSNPGGVRKQP